jgi:hypothetical protein
MKLRDLHSDSDLPRIVERHIDIDDVPEDMLAGLAYEANVRATFDHYDHKDLYIDWPTDFNTYEYKQSGCDKESLFPH